MPVLRNDRHELNLFRVGLASVLAIALVLGLALNSGSIARHLTSHSYSALFTEAGGLNVGDEVRVGGVLVGKVDAVQLKGRTVEVSFTVYTGSNLGSTTGAAIKTATPLGSKYLSVLPAGGGELPAGARIPLDRTSSPYDVQALLEQLTRKTEALDVPQLAGAMNTLSDTFADTSPALRGTVDGLGRLSATLASRDEQLQSLLRNANGVSGILSERSTQLTTLITDGNGLLEELYRRRDAIRSLLANVTSVLNQFTGVVRDNDRQIGPALKELEDVLDLLNRNDKNLAASIEGLKNYTGGLGEALSGGPWFFALVPNLPPTNLAQQTLPSVLNQATPASPRLPVPLSAQPDGTPPR